MWRRAPAAGLVMAVVATVGVLGAAPASAAPELRVTPASGPPGTEIVVTGTGFAAAPIEIRWGGLSGPTIATATGPAFSVSAVVPDSPPNSHPVMAVITDGNSVSTSSASFQVTSGPAPAPAPEETTSTTSTTVAQPPPTAPTVSLPGGEAGGTPVRSGASGLTGGVDGGVDPDMAGTTNGAGGAGTSGSAPASGGTTATSTATTVAAGAGVTVTTAPPVAGGEPSRLMPGDQAAPTVPAPSGEGVTAAALAPARTSQSAGAVSNPALLVLGLALVFGGGVFLAIRNRQRA